MQDIEGAYRQINDIQKSTSIDGVIGHIQKVAKSVGIDYFVMTGLPIPGRKIDAMVIGTQLPEGWLDYYLGANLTDSDPCVRRCFSSIDPFNWSDVKPIAGREKQSLSVMNDARDHGMKQGVTIPIHTEDGLTAAVSFSGDQPEIQRSTIEALQICAYIGHGHIRSLQGSQFERIEILSAREHEVLKWAALGKTNDDIATILNLSRRTVEEHLRSCVHKLDATNVKQAIATGIYYKQLQL